MAECLQVHSRSGRVAVGGVIVVAVALTANAAPHSFAPGQVVSSASLNENFSSLESRIATLEGRVSVPAGTIVAFAGTTAPIGWYICDGSEKSRNENPLLFAAISIAHGGGDGVTTFNLPDLRGRFVRGADSGSGRDPDSASRIAPANGGALGDNIGSLQMDSFQGHSHNYSRTNYVQLGAAGNQNYDVTATPYQSVSASDAVASEFGEPRFGSETRPQNLAMNYIIKH